MICSIQDCGPNLEIFSNCKVIESNDCCPKYDCEEGIEVVYVTAKAKEEKAKEADAPSGNAPITGEKTSDS